MTSPAPATTLYARLGGAAGISDLVVEFYERVLHDPELAPFFQHVSMPHLRHMQVAFFTMATGGPPPEAASSIKDAHAGRGIHERHYQRFVEHLLATLTARGLDAEDVDAIVTRLALERDDVIDDPGSPD
jgi:truncated hemoglobin YjbI